MKKNISSTFVNKSHHGASVQVVRGFVDIFNPFTLKNLESHIVKRKVIFLTAEKIANIFMVKNVPAV